MSPTFQSLFFESDSLYEPQSRLKISRSNYFFSRLHHKLGKQIDALMQNFFQDMDHSFVRVSGRKRDRENYNLCPHCGAGLMSSTVIVIFPTEF